MNVVNSAVSITTAIIRTALHIPGVSPGRRIRSAKYPVRKDASQAAAVMIISFKNTDLSRSVTDAPWIILIAWFTD